MALSFAVMKLRHYLLLHSVNLISKADPIRYLLTRPVLSGRLGKWALQITEFDITYTSPEAIKGQAIADFLAAHPVPEDSPLNNIPDEEVNTIELSEPWELFFDGAATKERAGAGVVLISPEKGSLPYSFVLGKQCTCNMAEYEALIIGLKLALGVKASDLRVFGDSQLVINQ